MERLIVFSRVYLAAADLGGFFRLVNTASTNLSVVQPPVDAP
jgi:hypothetical protein